MLARDGQVGHGGRGPGDVHGGRAAVDAVLDEAGNPVVRLEGFRCAQLTGETDRQHPGLVVLTRQELA
ncbi:Uncharacterised protein [Mycobacteroides abscessus subsp. massiliense]|nr:Uncharacterised protein [Mycobacteroides abscessus subsp. massiliense]